MVAAGTVRKASFGIAALLLIEPFAYAHVVGPTTLTFPKAALAGFLVGLAARRSSPAPLGSSAIRPLIGGAAVLVAADALSIIPAVYLDAALRETLKAFEYFIILCSAAVAYADDPDETLAWSALAVATFVVCALALVQEMTVAPSGFYFHGRVVPRIAGPIDGPNQLAGWLELATPMLAARALFGKPAASARVEERRRFPMGVSLFGGLATLAVTTDLLTLSRAGIGALCIGLAVLFVAAWRCGCRRRLMYVLPLAVVPVVAVAATLTFANARGGVAEFAARFGMTSEQNVDNGLAPRTVLWKAGFRMFSSDPALGVGAGNYQWLTPTEGLIGVRTHANSVYVQALAETGILGFAGIVWTFGAVLSMTLRRAREPLFAGIAAGTIALAVHEAYDFLTFYPKVGELWWLMVGIGAGAAVFGTSSSQPAKSLPAPRGTRTLAREAIGSSPTASSP